MFLGSGWGETEGKEDVSSGFMHITEKKKSFREGFWKRESFGSKEDEQTIDAWLLFIEAFDG
jgi:hypothetical protein